MDRDPIDLEPRQYRVEPDNENFNWVGWWALFFFASIFGQPYTGQAISSVLLLISGFVAGRGYQRTRGSESMFAYGAGRKIALIISVLIFTVAFNLVTGHQ